MMLWLALQALPQMPLPLLERLEGKLEATPGQLQRACVELAKDWRTDKYLQKLEAMLIVTDGAELADHHRCWRCVGTRARHCCNWVWRVTSPLPQPVGFRKQTFSAEEIARKAMAIASDICVYTNGNLTVEAISK